MLPETLATLLLVAFTDGDVLVHTPGQLQNCLSTDDPKYVHVQNPSVAGESYGESNKSLALLDAVTQDYDNHRIWCSFSTLCLLQHHGASSIHVRLGRDRTDIRIYFRPDEDGPWVLQCRIVVKSALSVLTDAKLEAQFLYIKPGSTSEKGFRVSRLDLLHVSRPFFFIGVPTHVIDEGSPLSYWDLDEVRDKLPIIGGSCARRT
eukprot:scaffold926_cov408-Prasinococcus_capsulatus_cf.AAC.44